MTPRRSAAGLVALIVASCSCTAQDGGASQPPFGGLLGKNNPKIKRENGKVYIWAGPGDKWFDFTGAPMKPEDLQYGIGKDRIRSIDDPYFVKPDDPRLMQIPVSRYRPDERPKTSDDIMVIGYAIGDDVRAYPTAVLDGHELVNDKIGGKPVTVGW
ncbi:MAG: DUF3179 domain-containing protein [Planctomycetota bacterium]|nr:MAG: DUF3179 domain-containing protein [Planctomycetota bacterium]